MAQNEKQPNLQRILGDFGLTALAVSIVAVTFLGLSGLTPRIEQANDANVLGVSTKEQLVAYYPESAANLPFVSDITLTTATDLSGNAKATVQLKPLEATTYEVPLLKLKNTSATFKKVRVVPSFSLQSSFTTISIRYSGKMTEIVSTTGELFPLDLVLSPNTTAALEVIIQPTAALATPTTLTLTFTESR